MFARSLPILLFAALALIQVHSVRAANLVTYKLDPVHSQIVIFPDHLGFSHGIGRLRITQGWFQFDPDDWSTARADVVIDTTTVDMGDADWSAKVRAPAFLASEKWPTAHFIGERLEATGKDEGVLHGSLWLRGIRQPVELAVKLNRIGSDPYAFKRKAGFTASTRLDRFAFGMDGFREAIAGSVELRIEVEGIRQGKTRESDDDGTEKH